MRVEATINAEASPGHRANLAIILGGIPQRGRGKGLEKKARVFARLEGGAPIGAPPRADAGEPLLMRLAFRENNKSPQRDGRASCRERV